MKITAFNSSPRTERGNTNFMVSAFLEGAKEAGAEIENIFLARKNIKPCLGCFACWLKTPGKCAIKDDMAELLTKLVESDIVVLATPLYIFNVNSILKNFLDRIIPTADPHISICKDGSCRHAMRYDKFPKFVIISNCGFPERAQFRTLEAYFRQFSECTGTEILGEIYRESGELLKNDSFLLKPLLWKYKNALKKAGQEIATTMKLSDEIKKELVKPIISAESYIEHANKSFDKMLANIKN